MLCPPRVISCRGAVGTQYPLYPRKRRRERTIKFRLARDSPFEPIEKCLMGARGFANAVRQIGESLFHEFNWPFAHICKVFAGCLHRQKRDSLADLRAGIVPFEVRGKIALVVVTLQLKFEQIHPVAVN
jgi:hypothetical protein